MKIIVFFLTTIGLILSLQAWGKSQFKSCKEIEAKYISTSRVAFLFQYAVEIDDLCKPNDPAYKKLREALYGTLSTRQVDSLGRRFLEKCGETSKKCLDLVNKQVHVIRDLNGGGYGQEKANAVSEPDRYEQYKEKNPKVVLYCCQAMGQLVYSDDKKSLEDTVCTRNAIVCPSTLRFSSPIESAGAGSSQ